MFPTRRFGFVIRKGARWFKGREDCGKHDRERFMSLMRGNGDAGSCCISFTASFAGKETRPKDVEHGDEQIHERVARDLDNSICRCIQGTWNGDLVVLDRALSKSIVEGVEDEMNHEREVGLDFWSEID